MITCPYCQAENRIGARFCKDCAGEFPASPEDTRPIKNMELANHNTSIQSISNPTTTQPVQPDRIVDTEPSAGKNGINRRPPGAVFGDRFLYKGLIFSDNTQVRYLVSQLKSPDELQFRACPNPNCGALYAPINGEIEKYCTDCGTTLDSITDELVLIETIFPAPEILSTIANRGLAHANVRAPLAVFAESLGGEVRHCVVIPKVQPLETFPDAAQTLQWGVDLAYSLDYLHDNGISFQGQIEPSCLALDGGKAVWANFTCGHVVLQNPVTDRMADVRSLAGMLFQWLTGKTVYEPDPNLISTQNQVFELALEDPGFATALEFAEALKQTQQKINVPDVIDYRIGRSSHVGKLRSLNEDSMLTLELNRTLQSISRPLGLFVVADGMGGHAAGEIASGTIVNTMSERALIELMPSHLTQTAEQNYIEWLKAAVMQTNAAVYELRKAADTDMGSTLVAAILADDQAYIAHVGDSRAYLINDQGIHRLTTDHSLVERLIATNQITREEARYHPQRNVIYRTIGDKPEVDIELSSHTLQVGDYLLLCSDGLSGMVDDPGIQKAVLSAESPQVACDRLVVAANAAGGDDNITVIIVQLVAF